MTEYVRVMTDYVGVVEKKHIILHNNTINKDGTSDGKMYYICKRERKKYTYKLKFWMIVVKNIYSLGIRTFEQILN